MNDNPEPCQFCRQPVPTEGPECMPSVVLTPDALFVEAAIFDPGVTFFELDLGFYWCGIECFGRWIASRCALQAMEEKGSMTHKPLASQRPIREPRAHVPTGASCCPAGGGHHYRIDEPNDPTSPGTCKNCGLTKLHKNAAPDWVDWGDIETVPRGLGRLVAS